MKATTWRRGFTLAEMMTAVAIIVLLVAILVPALQGALYAAKLAKCGANMDSFAVSVNIYAHENKRHYPDRPTSRALKVTLTPQAQEGEWLVWYRTPMGLLRASWYGQNNAEGVEMADDRPIFQSILDVKATFLDPFVTPVDLMHPDSYDADTVVASYDILMGWDYQDEQKIVRIGDVMTYTTATRQFRWDILMMDRDTNVRQWSNPAPGVGTPFDQVAGSSHPARRGRFNEDVNTARASGIRDNAVSYWSSQYAMPGPRPSGTKLDRNFVHTDGSVEMIKGVHGGPVMAADDSGAYNGQARENMEDRRVVTLPLLRYKDWSAGTTQLPNRDSGGPAS